MAASEGLAGGSGKTHAGSLASHGLQLLLLPKQFLTVKNRFKF